MADIIKTTLATKTLEDLQPVVAEKSVIEPTLTKATVEAILTELKTPQGYGDIAVKVGFDKCTKKQVIEIANKRQDKIAELSALKEVVEPVEVITK